MCRGPFIAVANDGLTDHPTATRRKPLQYPKCKQPSEARRQGGAHRGNAEKQQRAEHDRPTTKRIGQRAVEQAHHCERKQVPAQRLLNHGHADIEMLGNGREGWQKRVDCKRPDHGQPGENEGQDHGIHEWVSVRMQKSMRRFRITPFIFRNFIPCVSMLESDPLVRTLRHPVLDGTDRV